MALEITGNIELSSGIVVNSLYCRTQAWLSENGLDVGCSPYFYTSKAAYDNGAPSVDIDGIKILTPYDRTTDGSDILLFSNEYVKFQLEAKGYSVTITDL